MEGLTPRQAGMHPAVALLAAVLCPLPVLLVAYPPLIDYPSHLAQLYVVLHIDSVPTFNQAYEVAWGLFPNMAFYAPGAVLAPLIGVPAYGKLFLYAALLFGVLGVLAINWALYGRLSPWTLIACVLVYSNILHWGFLSFLMTAALSLWAFALWIVLAPRREPWVDGVFVLITVLLYLGHAYAFAMFMASLAAYELGAAVTAAGEGWRRLWRSAVRLFAMGLTPTALFLVRPAGPAAAPAAWRDAVTLADRFYERLLYSIHVPREVVAFPTPDAGFAFLVLALLVLAVLLWRRVVVLAPAMLAVVALLALLCAVTPRAIAGGHLLADRLPTYGALLLFAAVGSGSAAPRVGWRMTLPILVAVVAMVGATAVVWRNDQGVYRQLAAAFERLPEGARLRVIMPYEGRWQFAVQPPLHHFASYAMLQRHAFVPHLWARPDQHPLKLKADHARWLAALRPATMRGDLAVLDEAHHREFASPAAVAGWDYVLIYKHPGFDPFAAGAPWLAEARLVAEGEVFRLFALADTGDAAAAGVPVPPRSGVLAGPGDIR